MIVNLPTNLMNWIMNPKQYKPATGMPALGVSSPDAADIAAYLYSLGGYERISALQQH
jgi:cytochrome c2